MSWKHRTICDDCNSIKLRDAAYRSYKDYSFTRAIDTLMDLDSAKKAAESISDLVKSVPSIKDMTVGELIPELESRIADIIMEQGGGEEWKDRLSGFSYEDDARGFIKGIVYGVVSDMPPIAEAHKRYGHYTRGYRDDLYDGCLVYFDAESVLKRSNPSYTPLAHEEWSEEVSRKYKEIASGMDDYFPQWRTCLKDFRPSLYLQGCIIKHFKNGKKIRDQYKLRPLVTANLASLITKEFVTQFHIL